MKKYEGITLKPIKLIETGITPVDIVLGGGLFKGMMAEFSGESGCGKSTTVVNINHNLMLRDKNFRCLYIDVEGGLTNSLLETMNMVKFLKEDRFVVINPLTFEETDDVLMSIIKDKEDNFDMVVVDSLTALCPGKLIETNIEAIQPGIISKLSSFFMMKYKPVFKRNGIISFLISQMRCQFDFKSFAGSTSDSGGGKAVRHYPDVRIRTTKGRTLKRKGMTPSGLKEVTYAQESSIWTLKNRVTRSDIPIYLPIIHGRGVSEPLFLRNLLANHKLLTGGSGGEFVLKFGEVS